MNKNIAKFLTIGAVSILGLTASATYAQENETNLSNQTVKIAIDVSDTVKAEKKLKNLLKAKNIENWINTTSPTGFIPNNLTIKYKDINETKDTKTSPGYARYSQEQGCYIFTSGNEFGTSYNSGFGKTLAEHVKFSDEQRGLAYELKVFHEMGHCILREIGFEQNIHIGSNQVKETIKTFFEDVSHESYQSEKSEKEVTPISLFDEHFADVYGSMLLIKKNGLTDDVLKILNYHQLKRFDDTNSLKNLNTPLESHSTGLAMREITKDENLAIILDPKVTEEDYLNLAVKITNISFEKTLATYNFVNSSSFSVDSFDFKVRSYLFDNIFLERDQKFKGKDIQIFGSGKSNSVLSNIGYDVYLELNEKYNISSIKDEDLQSFYDNNKDDIKAVSRKHLNNYIKEFKEANNIQYADLLKSTREHLNSIKKEDIPSQENIISQLEQTKSLNAKDVLSRIEKIRKDSLNQPVLQIKPQTH